MTIYQRKAGFRGDAVSPRRVARCSGFLVEGATYIPGWGLKLVVLSCKGSPGSVLDSSSSN